MSIGTLYQYFADKDGLLLGLLDQHLDNTDALVARLRELPTGRPDAAASGLVQLIAEHNTRQPQLARLLQEQASRSDRLQTRLAELRRTLAQDLADRLRPPLDPALPGPAPDASGSPAADRQPDQQRHLRADLCVRLVEHLVHTTALDPPPGVDRAEVLAEITTIATRCLAP